MSKSQTDARLVGTNWDAVTVTETDRANGNVARKVITRGNVCFDGGELIAKAIAKLRQGYEVRIQDGKGEDAIRLYPLVERGKSYMMCCAASMNGLRSSINDKLVDIRDLPKKPETGDGDEDGESAGVTPDVMITCEVCGHKQRIGKKR